jgi:uncharacterized membrane protein (DUF4010 family)
MEPAFQQLAVSALLGLLVGLQRERAAQPLAGLRTFALVTLLGCVSAMLARELESGWIVAAGMLGTLGVTIVAHLLNSRCGEKGTGPVCRNSPEGAAHTLDPSPFPSADAHPGTTTDAALLLMFAVGALTVVCPLPVAVAVGGGAAVLLQFKGELHGAARKLGDDDVRAIMQFVLITCIILPVLPDKNFGPGQFFPAAAAVKANLDVLNPRQIWWMVVLIVGLSLAGYISYKFLGRDAGILLGGVLGGAVSSTATTVSQARSASQAPAASNAAATVIMIASTVMYVRVMAAAAVVSPEVFLSTIIGPISILMLLTLLPAIVVWRLCRGESANLPEQKNPTHLASAVVFGLLYAAVLLALAVAKVYWSDRGLYSVAFLSGLTEMDAITLSTARMSALDARMADYGWRLIVVAAMANMVSKAALAGLLGGRRLLGRLALMFLLPLLGGAALLALI